MDIPVLVCLLSKKVKADTERDEILSRNKQVLYFIVSIFALVF